LCKLASQRDIEEGKTTLEEKERERERERERESGTRRMENTLDVKNDSNLYDVRAQYYKNGRSHGA